MRAADGLGKTFRLSKNLDGVSKNLDVQLQGSVDRPKGTQVLLLFVATLTGQKVHRFFAHVLQLKLGWKPCLSKRVERGKLVVC